MTAEQRAACARTFFWVVVAVLLYVTTVPFGLETSVNFARKWLRTEILPFYLRKGESYHFFDLLGNLLLFLPFGFALQGWRLTRQSPLGAGLWPAIMGGMLMSLAIETTQFFLKDRFSSINDWVVNVAGTAAGAGLARCCFAAALDRWLQFSRKLLQRPGALVLLLLLFAYALWMLLPFNFTLSTHNFLRKWLQWKFSVAHLVSLPHENLTLDRREYWPLVVLENVLFGLLLGTQFIWCCHWYRPDHRSFFRKATALLGLALLLIALLQFIVIGSNPDVLPLLAVVGGVITALTITKKRPSGHKLISPSLIQPARAVAWLSLPLLLLLLMLLLLRPDLPDLRVAQIQSLQSNGASRSIAALSSNLLDSIRPSILQLGGSAYFRLFLKLLLISAPVAFVLAQMGLRGFEVVGKHHFLAAAFFGATVGLLAQVLRFFLWQGSVSLLAVFALMLGSIIGLWLATRWDRIRPVLQQNTPSPSAFLEQRSGNRDVSS